jgi:aarF domain-containing kinase
LLDGIPVDQCFEMEPEDRRFIAEKIIELCLLELLEFRYMQTDPNWANFLYNPKKKQIMLLDFGASREYSKPFMDQYVRILKAACDSDRETVLAVSKDLGFLTGYESRLMEDAHVDAVMILGEVFRCPEAYDFAGQDMTARIQNLVPTMVTHRLCPPPEEVYSLHRKLSGIFLLCSKLRASVSCRQKFLSLYRKYTNSM